MDEDFDLIARTFKSVLDLNDFIKHFEDDNFEVDDNYWRFGYKPKYIVVDGPILVNMGS